MKRECILLSGHSLRSSKPGFSLVELLTVIAVIGILAGILIPVISRMRMSGSTVQCVSNLRNMQLANNMYAAQNNNRYLSGLSFDSERNMEHTWLANVEYYEMLTSMRDEQRANSRSWEHDLLCPATRAMGSPRWDYIGANYGINYLLLRAELDLPAWGVEGSWSIPTSKIEHPAQTVAFADSVDWLLKRLDGYSLSDEEENGYNSGGYLAFRHGGKANAVNFDASVDTYTVEDIARPEIRKRFTQREE